MEHWPYITYLLGASYTPSVNSEMVVPNAMAMVSTFRKPTFRLPRSIPLMYVRSRLHFAAKSSCENPNPVRFSRTRDPKRSRTFISRLIMSMILKFVTMSLRTIRHRTMSQRTMSHMRFWPGIVGSQRLEFLEAWPAE